MEHSAEVYNTNLNVSIQSRKGMRSRVDKVRGQEAHSLVN